MPVASASIGFATASLGNPLVVGDNAHLVKGRSPIGGPDAEQTTRHNPGLLQMLVAEALNHWVVPECTGVGPLEDNAAVCLEDIAGSIPESQEVIRESSTYFGGWVEALFVATTPLTRECTP
jgi:hypothetical protein